MKFDAEGKVVFNETEKETVIEGLKLMAFYCDSGLGCGECPFFNPMLKARQCELNHFLPCAWTIPDTFEEGKK